MKYIFITLLILIHFKNGDSFTKLKVLATGLCLESNKIKYVFTNFCSSNRAQKWIASNEQFINGVLNFQLINVGTSLCLDADNISKKIFTSECDGRDSQKWSYTWNKDIQNADTGMCLESNFGNKAYLNQCNGVTFQKWSKYEENIVFVESNTTNQEITSQRNIETTTHVDKCVDNESDFYPIQYRFGCNKDLCWTWCNEGKGWCYTNKTCNSYKDCDIASECAQTCITNKPGDENSTVKYRYGCGKTGRCWTFCREGKGWCYTNQKCTSYKDCNINSECET